MPLIDQPHMVVEVVVDVTFCDGAHPEGVGTRHPCRRNVSILVVIPPLDDVPSWPPPADDEDAQHEVIDRVTLPLLARLTALMTELPGATGLLMGMGEIEDDEEGDGR